MRWLPTWLGGESSTPNIDPKVREFLEREAPKRYEPSQPSSVPQSYRETTLPPSSSTAAKDNPSEREVPRESLFQDGRYAHLWKGYTPQYKIEEDAMTEHDRMSDVLANFQNRKVEIQKAAMENCAFQQEEWTNCMKHGSWEDQLQMCRHQVRRFERCYTMQMSFLRALGYGNAIGRPASVDEDIQMHADALFQRFLGHEAAAKAAREEGRPVPDFDPAIPGISKNSVQPSDETRRNWEKVLHDMTPEERKVEEAALRADLQGKTEIAKTIREIREGEKKARLESGNGTFGDYLNGLWNVWTKK